MSGVSLGHAAATGRCSSRSANARSYGARAGQRSGGPSRSHAGPNRGRRWCPYPHRRGSTRAAALRVRCPAKTGRSVGQGLTMATTCGRAALRPPKLPLGVDHVPAEADDRPLLLDRHYSRLGADRGPRHRVRRSARRLRRDAERRTRTRAPKFGGTALAVALRTACRCLAVGSEGDSPLQPGPSPAASLKPCWRAA
jgi:hypothetical protein